MAEYILAIDQSTSGTKAIILNKEGQIVARSDKEHKQITNTLGYVEHNLTEIWDNINYIIKDVIGKSKINKSEIILISVSNQRETAAFWDKNTGEQLHNAIVWQCARGDNICIEINNKGYSEKIKEITGLNLSPYFTASKISWVLENNKNIEIENLCAGTIDSWLIYKLTNGKVFATDYSNASRTQLFDIKKLEWSKEVLEIFKIPRSILPTPLFSDSIFGETTLDNYFDKPIKICGVLGDSHGALFGQGCIKPGMIKATYGTGSSIMANIGNKPFTNSKAVVSSIAWGRNEKVDYVLEGNINYTGAVIKWLCDDLQLISSPKETAELAESANPEDTTYLIPAFSGLSAPYWDTKAKGMFYGMTRLTKKAELVKAAEESIAYQIADVIEAVEKVSNKKITSLRVDGGPTKNQHLMQFQSDIIDTNIFVSDIEELSALGAAFMGGIKIGFFTENILDSINRIEYKPKMTKESRNKKLSGWQKALNIVLSN